MPPVDELAMLRLQLADETERCRQLETQLHDHQVRYRLIGEATEDVVWDRNWHWGEIGLRLRDLVKTGHVDRRAESLKSLIADAYAIALVDRELDTNRLFSWDRASCRKPIPAFRHDALEVRTSLQPSRHRWRAFRWSE